MVTLIELMSETNRKRHINIMLSLNSAILLHLLLLRWLIGTLDWTTSATHSPSQCSHRDKWMETFILILLCWCSQDLLEHFFWFS